MRRPVLASALLAIIVLAGLQVARAGEYSLRQELSAIPSGEGVANGIFGNSVAIDGDLAVASNLGDFPIPGIVRTYARSGATWSYLSGQDIIIPGDSSATLAFHEGMLALTAYDSTSNRSYLHIYSRNGSAWVLEYSTSSTSRVYEAVAAVDGIVVAGSPSYDGAAGADQGRILIVRRVAPSTWTSVLVLPTTPQAQARFGASVAIEAGTVVVGAPDETAGQSQAGAAYVFELTINTWSQVARLVDPSAGDHSQNRFGTAVAISGTDHAVPDHIVVTTLSNPSTSRVGRVYSITRSGGTWSQFGPILSSGTASDGFGCAIAMDGVWALVGSCTRTGQAAASGAVVLLQYSPDFSSANGVVASDPQGGVNEYLGSRLDVDRDGPNVIVGNPVAPRFGNPAQGVLLFANVQSLASFALVRQNDLGQGLSGAFVSVMAVDGDTLMIGAQAEDVGSQHQRGAVYVYQRGADGGYVYQTRLLAPDGMTDDRFGGVIVLQGDIALISALGREFNGEPQGGSVYVFHRDAGVWSLEAQLFPAVSGYEITFGFSLALDGDTAVIGEFGVNTTVYQRSGGGIWTPMQSIPHRAWAAQIRGDLMLLGDSNVDLGTNNVGEVAVYVRSGGIWQAQGTLAGTSTGQGFGRGISFDGTLLAVASLEAMRPVVVYRRNANGWLPETNVLPDDVTADMSCSRVALRDDTMVVGCFKPEYEGAAYVFRKSAGNWSQTQKLQLDDARPNDLFGFDIAQSGDGSIFVGALRRDIDFVDQGAVYVYTDDTLFANGFD
ncbi:FG-GAP repeat protein [Dokdonella sp.]|uniref:FG-GAP repeat protein n=1 Tax=Dokdonella sp. TaxID=2291710 RepID=UPI003527F3C7